MALHRELGWRDLAWRLGSDDQVTDEANRQAEIRNFLGMLAGKLDAWNR